MISYLTLAILVALGSVSKLYKRWISVSLGFELKTFITIAIAYKLGFYPAMICAALMVLFSAAIANRIPHAHWLIIKVAAYAAVCASVLYFKPMGLVLSGLVASVVLNMIYVSSNFLIGEHRYQDLLGNVVNIFLTFVLLKSLGAALVKIL